MQDNESRSFRRAAALMAACGLALLFGGDTLRDVGRGVARIPVCVRNGLSSKGLRVVYFKGMNFEKRRAVRTERAVDFDYGRSRPVWCVPRNGYSVRWEGWLLVPTDANYTFVLHSDDGSRLFLDGVPVIEHWGEHGWDPAGRAERQLKQGPHAIRIEHCNVTGPAAIRLCWQGGPIPADTVLAVPYLRKRL